MIRQIRIEDYKSIPDLTLDLGRVTVLIGANGSGKSNILEAIAVAAAASQFKLDNEFLSSRGIRVTNPRFFRSAFVNSRSPGKSITVSVKKDDEDHPFVYELSADEKVSYPRWRRQDAPRHALANAIIASRPALSKDDDLESILTEAIERREHYFAIAAGSLAQFLIFAPENLSLREFQSPGQILPLGNRGEGLFAHLKALDSEDCRNRLDKIRDKLSVIDWFESFEIPTDLAPGERGIRIRDRYLPEDALFDQRSANEGFLFLLFYLTLLISPETPAFFSIDNIDNSLNPKLCIALLQQIAILAREHDKQVILTTHNPAVLDGLNLNDDEQRLLVVDRNKEGHTRVRRVEAPKTIAGQAPVSLSEAFMRGFIGGLPKNF